MREDEKDEKNLELRSDLIKHQSISLRLSYLAFSSFSSVLIFLGGSLPLNRLPKTLDVHLPLHGASSNLCNAGCYNEKSGFHDSMENSADDPQSRLQATFIAIERTVAGSSLRDRLR